MRRAAASVGAVALTLVLAACGSSLDPEQVAGAGAARTVSQGGPVDAVDGVAPGAVTDPDAAGPGDVPGADVAPGSGAPGVPGPAPDGGGGPDQPAPDGSGPSEVPDENSPTGDDKAASCDGFEDGPGITADTITIGNASDISGPVPGLFESSQQAVQAYVAYFNASGSTICGRTLKLISYDSRTDAAADQQNYAKACDETFAVVGSMSGFDGGGAATAQGCGLPDIRAISTTGQRAACSTCYAAQPAGPDEFENAVPDFIKRNYDGGQKAAMLYLNGGAAAENGPSQVALMTKRGMKFVYVSAVELAEFNYVPYVQAMKDKGVETVQFVGANPQFVRLAQTMEQQGFKPDLLLLDPTAYSSEYTSPAASAADDTVVFTNFTPFEESRTNPEVALYLSWLDQVRPGAEPDFFGLFAWSAARLFVERATALGGGLDRASLVASMKGVKGWTSNDLHAPMNVGAKKIADCWRFIQWSGSAWGALEGTKYQCNGVTS